MSFSTIIQYGIEGKWQFTSQMAIFVHQLEIPRLIEVLGPKNVGVLFHSGRFVLFVGLSFCKSLELSSKGYYENITGSVKVYTSGEHVVENDKLVEACSNQRWSRHASRTPKALISTKKSINLSIFYEDSIISCNTFKFFKKRFYS